MYPYYGEESDCSQHLISELEQQAAYSGMMDLQKDKFIEEAQALIKRYLGERRELMESFGMSADEKALKQIFREVYNLSVKSVMEYFGIRRAQQ